MNHAMVWRLLWKEYRQQRAVWISVLGLAVGVLLLAMVASAMQQQPLATYTLLAIALVAPAVYALGCGATLFAAEHEEETFAFHQALPVSSGRIFWTKMVFVLASTVLLAPILWLIVAVLRRGDFPPAYQHWQLVAAVSVATLEIVAWAVFFSLVLERPLRAAVLAVAVASTVVHGVVPLWPFDEWEATGFETYFSGWPFRLALAGIVLLVDWRLGRRWLCERRVSTRGAAVIDSIAESAVSNSPVRVTAARRPWARLLWLEWRQSWRLAVTLGAIYVLAYGWFLAAAIRSGDHGGPMFPLMLGLLAALHGGCVFLADKQGEQYRFFAEHGIQPNQVWLTRQALWFGLLACWALPTALLWIATTFTYPVSYSIGNAAMPGIPVLTVLAFAAGQTCSTFFRSRILANMFAIVAAALLSGWALLMYFLNVSLLLAVAPLPVALLFATWLRTKDWIVDRSNWRAWLRAAGSIMVPVGIVIGAVIWWRVTEYPEEGPGFDVQAFTRPVTQQERATADMYKKAWMSLDREPPYRSDTDVAPVDAPESDRDTREQVQAKALLATMEGWVKEHRDSLQIAIEASRRPDCAFPQQTANTNWDALSRSQRLGALLYWNGRTLEAEGDTVKALESYLAGLRYARHLRQRTTYWKWTVADTLETAILERLPHWAAQPGVTSQQVVSAMAQVDEIIRTMPKRIDVMKACYVVTSDALADHDRFAQIVFESPLNRTAAYTFVLLERLMPWEVTRAKRVLAYVVRKEINRWDDAVAALDRGPPTKPPSFSNFRFVILTTPVLAVLVQESDVLADFLTNGDDLGSARTRIAHRRATRLVLALCAYHIDHGQLPATPDELVEDYLGEIPLDPYSGEPLKYFPEGFSKAIHYRAPRAMDQTFSTLVAPGQAFVRSARQNPYDYPSTSERTRDRTVGSDAEVQFRMVFPIPLRKAKPIRGSWLQSQSENRR